MEQIRISAGQNNGIRTLKLVLCPFLICSVVGRADAHRPEKPNVLLLTDDLGWQDVGCYDIDESTPYETPHKDALAGKWGMLQAGLDTGAGTYRITCNIPLEGKAESNWVLKKDESGEMP